MPLKRKLCHGSVGGKVKVHLRENTDADHDFRGLESPNTKPQARKVEMGILESQQDEPCTEASTGQERFESR